MKKVAICILPVLCAGCFGPIGPDKMIYNPQCAVKTYARIEIFQVGQEYTLVNSGEIFAVKTSELKKSFDEIYDGMEIISLGYEQSRNIDESKKELLHCPVFDGTYKYITAGGFEKTVRKLTFIPAWIPNPAYETWKTKQDQKAKNQ